MIDRSVQVGEPRLSIDQEYTNTDFISLMIDKCFYEDSERNARKLYILPEYGFVKVLDGFNKKMKRAIRLEKKDWESRK